jgi:hypothetical protein
MISDTIDEMVAAQITTDQIIERAFGVAHRFEAGAASHVKSASRSSCTCQYCAAIKQYVRAKIVAKRVSRDVPPYDERYAHLYNLSLERRADANARLTAATAVKNRVAPPVLSMADLLPA